MNLMMFTAQLYFLRYFRFYNYDYNYAHLHLKIGCTNNNYRLNNPNGEELTRLNKDISSLTSFVYEV